MTRPGMHRRRTLALVLACLGISSAALAQATPQGPIVFGEREKRDTFTLNWWRAALEGSYRYQKDKQQIPGEPKTTFTEHRFEETFSLETNSAIYHPNLCELNAAGSFGLTQTKVTDEPGDSDTQLGTVYEWDINALFLRKEDTTYTLYSRRTVDTVDRTLGPSLDNTITTTGGIADIRNVKIPTRIEIFHSDEEQKGIDDTGGSFTLSQNVLLWHSEYRPTSRNTFTLDYNLSQVSEDTTGYPSNDYLLNDFTFAHTYRFGEKDQHSIDSNFNYFNQTGDLPLERMRLTEDLRLKHTSSFETEYRYIWDRQDYEENTQTTNRGTAGFTHHLYKSLTTTGEVGVEKITQSEGGGSLQYFADINFDYTKIVPYGNFDGGMGFAWSNQKNDANDGLAILNQVVTFNDPAPVVITSPTGVDTQSIILTDSRGLITYTPGVDYTVTVFPTRVEIDRVVGGRIEDGQSVLLDYTTLPAGGNTSVTNTFSLSLRYNFEEGFLKGLSPYFRFVDQRQSVHSTDDESTFTPNSYTDTVVGVEYRIWRLTLGFEREWYESTIQPFNATRYTARYVDRWSRDTVVNADARYEQDEYLDDHNKVNFFIVSATLNHRFSTELNGSFSMLYRNEQDELNGNAKGLEEQVEIYWQKRQLRVYAELRNVDVNSDSEDRHFQSFRVGMRREF